MLINTENIIVIGVVIWRSKTNFIQIGPIVRSPLVKYERTYMYIKIAFDYIWLPISVLKEVFPNLRR